MIHPSLQIRSCNRTVVAAIRFARALLKQSRMHPWLTALAISFVLGVIPMMITAFYSAALALAGWYRHSYLLRHDGPAIRHPGKQLINPLELL